MLINKTSIGLNLDGSKNGCTKNGIYLQCEEEIRQLIIEEMEQVKQKNLDSDSLLKAGCDNLLLFRHNSPSVVSNP